MKNSVLPFPDNFFWGAATSSHQVEGGNKNNWTQWENKRAIDLAQQAQARFDAEVEFAGGQSTTTIPHEASQSENYISGKACDHYNRFEEDFDIAVSLGHNAHRFSVEWSRIEPEEGVFDQHAIEHYTDVIAALRKKGVEPFVTLWHWTIPIWLEEKGGVEHSSFPTYFERYTKKIVEALGDSVQYWMTLNEPTSVILNGYVRGVWPPEKKSIFRAWRVYHRLAQAHKRAYRIIHTLYPKAEVGIGHALVYAEPYTSRWPDKVATKIGQFVSNTYFIHLVQGTQDYIGVQYYFHQRIQFPMRSVNENTRVSDLGWELYPQGIYGLLMQLKSYNVPLYITESGLADSTDQYREWYIIESIRAIHQAIQEGADVRGYFYWSLLDNFEWDKGFWPRFGLVAIDRSTLERTIRPSAYTYKNICTTNTVY